MLQRSLLSLFCGRKCLHVFVWLFLNVRLAVPALRNSKSNVHVKAFLKMAWCDDVNFREQFIVEGLVAETE